MRFRDVTIAASFVVAAAGCPQLAAAQDARDFVFTDVEGHMILRFVGTSPGGLDPSQTEEVVNVSLSTMVHDRLRADALFEAESVDPHWADSMAPRIRRHVDESELEFSAIDVECRSSSCRLVLEHAQRLRLSEHRALMGAVELAVRAFIDAHQASLDPVFLIAAYNQESETPNVKVFLRRATSPAQTRQRTGG